jgi:ubiquinone/menaquinone biosynthesis C-methylase UbiE
MQSYEYQTMRAFEDSYWWYIGLRTRVVRSLQQALDTRNARILDAGCGTGGMMSLMRSHFPDADIIGIDVSGQAVRATQARNVGEIINASVDILPFREDIFDVIVSLDVVLEMKAVNDTSAIKEIYRILKKGGLLVLNLTAFECLRGQHDAAVHVAQRYIKKRLKLFLQDAGFSIVHMTYWNAIFFPLLVIWRPLSRLFANASQPVSDLRPLPPLINKALTYIILQELKLTHYLSLPFGSSIFAVAKKK